jgi:hypothetical protein
MTDDELKAAIHAARGIAGKVGPMHARWDTIFDAEAILQGKPSMLKRPVIEKMLVEATAGLPR